MGQGKRGMEWRDGVGGDDGGVREGQELENDNDNDDRQQRIQDPYRVGNEAAERYTLVQRVKGNTRRRRCQLATMTSSESTSSGAQREGESSVRPSSVLDKYAKATEESMYSADPDNRVLQWQTESQNGLYQLSLEKSDSVAMRDAA